MRGCLKLGSIGCLGLVALVVVVVVVGTLLPEQDDEPTTPTPTPIAPASYEWVEQEDLSIPARGRMAGHITIAPASSAATGAALAAAVQEMFTDHDDVQVVVIFGYGPDDDTEGAFTRGIATGSRDGQGWAGDGLLLGSFGSGQQDDGDITVIVGPSFGGDQETMSFPSP